MNLFIHERSAYKTMTILGQPFERRKQNLSPHGCRMVAEALIRSVYRTAPK